MLIAKIAATAALILFSVGYTFCAVFYQGPYHIGKVERVGASMMLAAGAATLVAGVAAIWRI